MQVLHSFRRDQRGGTTFIGLIFDEGNGGRQSQSLCSFAIGGRGPKRTISCYDGVEPRMWWGPRPGCDNLVSEPIPGQMCVDEDVRPLRGVVVTSHIA
ncbi:hypothetical protein ACFX11_032845 [Malus domestica]